MPDPQFALQLDPKKLGTVPDAATTLDPKKLGQVPDTLTPDPNADPDDQGEVASAWHWMNSPLAPQIAQAAHAIATKMTTPQEGIPPELAMGRGFLAGVTQGIGDVASSFTSPVSLVLLATGIGPESDVARRLPAVQKILQLPEVQALYKSVHGLAGAGFAGHGAYTAATAPDLAGKAQGVAEFAMGASGAANAVEGTFLGRPVGRTPPATEVAPPVPKYVPHRAPGPRAMDPEAQAAADEALQRQYFNAVNDPRTPGAGGTPSPTQAPSPWKVSETRRQEMMRTLGGQAGQINADPTAVQPTATFKGWQQGIEDIPPTPLYDVQGGPYHRSTVGPARLTELGIATPDTPDMPPEFQSQFGGAEPGAEMAHDEPVPSVKKPTWIRNTEDSGGRWVLPSGEFEAGPDARTAQTTMRARGMDPFSKTGVPIAPSSLEPMGLATVPKEEPGWEQGAEGGMPGFYSPLRRMVEALPDRGIPPARFLSMADKVVSPDEMGWKGVRDWVADYQKRNGNAPIPKEDLQQLLENTRIVVKQIVAGGSQTTPFTNIGETRPHPSIELYDEPFMDFDTFKQRVAEIHGPTSEHLTQERYDINKQAHENNRQAFKGHQIIDVTTPDGTVDFAVIKPDGQGRFRATLPGGVADSLTANGDVDANVTNTFDTPTEAEAWIRERLKAGSTAGQVDARWGSGQYAVPGYVADASQGPVPQRDYREDLFTVPGQIPSNRVENEAFRNTTHYNQWNIVGTARGQHDYTLPHPTDPNAPPVHGTLIDEAQSDIHQKAKRARRLEVKRLRDEAALKLTDKDPNLTLRAAREQVPLASFEKQVPENFGYRSRELGEQLNAAQATHDEIDSELDALLEKSQEIQHELRAAVTKRRQQYLEQAGFTSMSELEDATYPGRYSSVTGQRYGAARASDMSPEDAETYQRAKAVKDQIENSNETTPEITEATAKLEAVKQEREALQVRLREARDAMRTLQNAASTAVGGLLPYKGDAWNTLVGKREIYEVATDPKKSFIGIVGGQENADRYDYSRSFSKVRFNPENKTLHAYNLDGTELRGTWGGQDETQITMPAKIDTSSPSYMQKDLEKYLPEELAENLVEKIQGYTPVMRPGELIPPKNKLGWSGEAGTDEYRTNDPSDDDRWGTYHERQRAREDYAEREAEYARESEREQWKVEEVNTDELDPDAEENEPYFAELERVKQARENYVNQSRMPPHPEDHPLQPLLPGFEDWSPEQIADMMFPDPEVPEDAVYTTKWRATAEWMGDDEQENEDHLFDTEREAEQHVDSYVDDAASNMDIDWPDDEDLYGPNGADLTDHYDPDFDPDREEEENDDAEPETPQYGPGSADPAAHPTLQGLDLKMGGKGMFTFYDQAFKTRIEKLVKPFGEPIPGPYFEGKMQKVEIPSKVNPGEMTYGWIAYLNEAQMAEIAKKGFTIMALALAMKDTVAPQEIKDRLMRYAIMDARRNKQTDKGPGRLGRTPTPTQVLTRQ